LPGVSVSRPARLGQDEACNQAAPTVRKFGAANVILARSRDTGALSIVQAAPRLPQAIVQPTSMNGSSPDQSPGRAAHSSNPDVALDSAPRGVCRYCGRGDCDRMIAMKAALKVRMVLMLVASCAASAAGAETESGSTSVPETVAPPGIIVMPPRLPPPMSLPGAQSPVGDRAPHTCPAN